MTIAAGMLNRNRREIDHILVRVKYPMRILRVVIEISERIPLQASTT
jgi:hypothetical protein